MAIFTEETKFTEKYFNQFKDALNNVPQEQLEKEFDIIYPESSFNADSLVEQGTSIIEFKKQLIKWDFQKFIESILDRHQDEDCNLISDVDIIEEEMQVVLMPLYSGDVLFYSREIAKCGLITTKAMIRDIIEDMEDK